MATNAFTEKMLNELFNKYKADTASAQSGENIELEIRFKDITREAFEEIYKHISTSNEFGNATLECSVNVISENVYERNIGGKADETQYIRKIIFNKGTVIADTYLQKTRLVKPVHINDYIKYSVGLSRELESKKFATNTNALLRFKVRVSFDYIGHPPHPAKWRFDLTAVKHGVLSEMGNSLKTIKNDLFTASLAPDNFLRELNFDMIDSFEVEIEHIDKVKTLVAEDLNIAKKVFAMVNPAYITEIAYQEEIYSVAENIVTNQNILHMFKQPTHRLKQLSNQVIALSKNTYYADVFPPNGFYLTEKADGQRALISINGNRCRVLLSDGMYEFMEGTFTPGPITICDSELIWNSKLKNPKAEKTDHFTLYIFDVMVFRDDNVSKSGFSVRSNHLADAAKQVDEFVQKGGHAAKTKNYIRLDENKLEDGFREIYEQEYPYIIDGLILTEPDEPYFTTKNYKWKPYERNTIDFLAVKCPQKLLGIRPYDVKNGKDLYLLFVGINHQMREKLGMGFIPQYRSMFPETNGQYYPIQFSPSIAPLAYLYYHDSAKYGNIDRQIVELARNDDNTEWVYHHVRTDRKLEKNYFGNDFRIAELTYLNYIDPFTFEELWKPASSYFTKQASDIYTAANKFKRFVISLLLKDNLSGSKWIIDEAAGRGGDLHRYQEIGVENALFIDIDPTAIAELVRRKFAFFAVKKRHIRNWFQDQKKGGDGASEVKVVTQYDRIHDVEYEKLIVKDVKSLTVHTLVADLKTPYKDLIVDTFQFGLNVGLADGIICNFALHYMCDTIEHLRNMLIFNAKMLKVGGLFIFTVMNGKKIFDLLKPLSFGQQWESREDGVLKYAIRKDYRGDKLTPTGQMISVLLPFSDEMYQEPLCNIDTVVAEAGKLGFELELCGPMTTYMDKFGRADRALADRLTDEDKKYIELHSYVSLRKVKEIKKLADE